VEELVARVEEAVPVEKIFFVSYTSEGLPFFREAGRLRLVFEPSVPPAPPFPAVSQPSPEQFELGLDGPDLPAEPKKKTS
jgi:hypothetical protein